MPLDHWCSCMHVYMCMTPPYTYVRVPLYTRTRIRIRTLMKRVKQLLPLKSLYHPQWPNLDLANIIPQYRLVSTDFKSNSTKLFYLAWSKCWRYMHHIKSDILTFHLSPILPELRWRVLRYVWLNPRMSQWVQWFFSLPSVAWDDFARARPAHSMRETVRARGKPLTASDSPILWAGCNRAKIVPWYRWGDQCTGIAPTVRGFGHKYPILASSYFNKVFLK